MMGEPHMWWPRAQGAAQPPAGCCPAGPGLCCGADAHSAQLCRQGSISAGHPAVTPCYSSLCVPLSLTILVHASLQALLEPAGLALVAVSLVHRAQPCPCLAPMGRGGTWLQPLRWPLSPIGTMSPPMGSLHPSAPPLWAPCPQEVSCPQWVPCPQSKGALSQ